MLAHLRRNLTRHKTINEAILQQHRHSHQRVHRTINVKLLEDIPGVGARGSIQSVAPGRMRHTFYPQKKASYIIPDAGRRSPLQRNNEASSEGEVNFTDLKVRLRALDTIIFQQSIDISIPKTSTSGRQIIKEYITPEDIAQRLSDDHNLNVLPPFAHLSLRESSGGDHILMTGTYNVLVHLQTGDILTIKVLVEPKRDIGDNGQVQQSEHIAAATS